VALQEIDFLKAWSSVADDCSDPWFRFIARWIAFNAYYSAMHPSKGDKAGVKKMGVDPVWVGLHKSLLQEPNYKASVDFFISRNGVADMNDRGGAGHRVQIADLNDWNQVLLCIYQVRCNLFHGDKLPHARNDSDVVENADNILSGVVNRFLKNS
jgi:hypothetical protein